MHTTIGGWVSPSIHLVSHLGGQEPEEAVVVWQVDAGEERACADGGGGKAAAAVAVAAAATAVVGGEGNDGVQHLAEGLSLQLGEGPRGPGPGPLPRVLGIIVVLIFLPALLLGRVPLPGGRPSLLGGPLLPRLVVALFLPLSRHQRPLLEDEDTLEARSMVSLIKEKEWKKRRNSPLPPN